MEAYVMCVIKCLVALFALYLYTFLVCRIFPWFTMRLVWRGDKYMPRGKRKVVFEGGRGVVYEPAAHVRKYIRQYAIFTADKNKFIRCEINGSIKFMRYDIVSFDVRGRLLDVVRVKEHIGGHCGQTQPVALPADTAYACVVPRRVDNEYRGKERVLGYSVWGSSIFMALTVIATLVMTWFWYDGLSSLMTLVIPAFESASLFAVMLRALLWGIISGAVALIAYSIHSVRVINK